MMEFVSGVGWGGVNEASPPLVKESVNRGS